MTKGFKPLTFFADYDTSRRARRYLRGAREYIREERVRDRHRQRQAIRDAMAHGMDIELATITGRVRA